MTTTLNRTAIASDCTCHLTREIIAYLREKDVPLELCGALNDEPCDFVDAASAVAEKVMSGACAEGLIFCNTGTGVTIVANKFPGVRAALCVDAFSARIARLANNANVIVLGVRLTGEILAKEIVDAWLTTQPSTEPRRVRFHEKTDLVDAKYRSRIHP